MCARPFSMLWHGRKSGAATLTRSCARWSCCPCLALALEVWAKMVCSSDLFPDDFQLLQLKTWKNTFSSLSLYMFLCQMVLLSMSFPCSWCLAPDGGVATFFPDVLDLHWLAHLKILEMGLFFGKVLVLYTLLWKITLLSMSCPCSWCLGKVCLLLTFLCLDFQLVQVIVLEIIYICAEGLLVFVLVPACGVATLILDFPYLSWHTSRSKKISFFRCRRTWSWATWRCCQCLALGEVARRCELEVAAPQFAVITNQYSAP